MDINCYLDRDGVGAGNQIIRNFAYGCKGILRNPDKAYPGIGVFWGILRGNTELIHEHIKKGQPYLHMDHAYMQRGHSKQNYRVTLNGLQETGPINFNRPQDRLDKFNPPYSPIRTSGTKITICPPTDPICKFYNISSDQWLSDTIRSIQNNTDREIVIRRKGDAKPLNVSLEETYALITFNSNTATDAVISGVPIYTSDYSAGRRVGYGLGSLYSLYDDKPLWPAPVWDWMKHLAYHQFTMMELINGKAWSIIKEGRL